ncbi:MAG: FUSC family membrane protein [Chitinophagaceae bacterium]
MQVSINSYRSFLNSHYLSDGIRMTAGILAPAVILSYFDMLEVGVVISLGAMAVSTPDSAGPIHHRRIAMTVCLAAIFIQALVTGLIASSPILLGTWIVISCFFFSMLGIFGVRAGAVGIAALLIMILNMDHYRKGIDVVYNALYILAGGTWYMIFSLILYNVRPYKLAQQALGECIQSTSRYLLIRGQFYNKGMHTEEVYGKLFHEQVSVQEKQSLLNEILFKTREIVKESTNTGRVLIMIYLDVTELYERLMTSYQDYDQLHEMFEETGILAEIRSLIVQSANELDEIGIAVKGGSPSLPNQSLWKHLGAVQETYTRLRQTWLKPENVEGFISLRRILDNVQDIAGRIEVLHQYTTYDKKLKKNAAHKVDYEQFVTHQEISGQIFLDNLNFQSNLFRHSLRVSVAALVGYASSFFFNFGHRYWILLTIVVILKPAYSLSKRRNTDRLFGTLIGAVIGVSSFSILKKIQDI